MARWTLVDVQLLGGRGQTFWPPPGRVMVVGPRHTFADLAGAVDLAFGRWDRGHLCRFTLPDGGVVSDEETLEDSSAPRRLHLSAQVLDVLGPGSSFRYEFDLGDRWTHACTVAEEYVDPVDELGSTPERPTPCFGWGPLPDQYGRAWRSDPHRDPPPRTETHPMLDPRWPREKLPPVDERELRGAVARADVEAILRAVRGHDVSAVLQRAGEALETALRAGSGEAGSLAADLVARLRDRSWEGDDVLVEDLSALVQGTPLPGRELPVELDELADTLEGPFDESGGYLDLGTGQVLPGILTDPAMVGEEDVVDVEEDPDRWLYLERMGSGDAYHDMELFTERVTDRALREALEHALSGKGPFRRFKDVVFEHGMGEAWLAFANERSTGRARAYLAREGIRVVPGPPV